MINVFTTMHVLDQNFENDVKFSYCPILHNTKHYDNARITANKKVVCPNIHCSDFQLGGLSVISWQ